jgi:KaiC/GvpD/RAD55 family RecA-like ATPase
MERKFIKSGIPGLDEALGGGFLEGSVITVSGPTGSGKSSFAAQFIYSGAADHDEPGIYIAIEESRRDFLFHMGGFVWDFESLERDRKFILLDYPIHEVDQIINQTAAIQEIINSSGIKRVVIDSVMPIALYFKSDEERKTGFLKFIENLHKWNVTTLIVSEDLKIHSGSRPSSEYGIESFTDGWISLFFSYDEKTKERERNLEIVKMKGVSHSHRSWPATLTNAGFSISSGRAPLAEEKPMKLKPAPVRKAASEAEAPPAPGGRGDGPPAPPPKPLKTLRAMPPPWAKPPAAPPAQQQRPAATPSPAQKAAAQPSSAPAQQKGGTKTQQAGAAKAGPVKMTPALAARLAEAKKKIMKK